MHKPAEVVEILAQILQNTPYSVVTWYRIPPPPPPEMKIVIDDGALGVSWQTPPPPEWKLNRFGQIGQS